MTIQETTVKLTRLALLATIVLAAAPALASTIEVNYTGTVSYALGTTANSGYTDGQSISGEFFLDSVTGIVSGSTLGSFSAPANNGVSSPSSLSPTDAIYVQGAFASGGAPSNNSITVDFSALTSFSGSDPAAFLLQSPTALAQQIDFTGAASSFPSTATFYLATAGGTNITDLSAYLSGVTAAVVPLPNSLWLLMSAAAGLAALRRPRGAT
jgi:hypothetical protein